MKRLVAACAVVFGLAVNVHAQVDRATLSGTVRDPQGAPISVSSVVTTNSATNVAAQTKTNSEGNYVVVNLGPGRYRVEVESSGFQKSAQSVVLEVGQRGRADFGLKVGAMAE